MIDISILWMMFWKRNIIPLEGSSSKTSTSPPSPPCGRGERMPWNEENPVEHHMYWPKEDVDVSDLIAEIEWDYDFEICWYWFEIDLKLIWNLKLSSGLAEMSPSSAKIVSTPLIWDSHSPKSRLGDKAEGFSFGLKVSAHFYGNGGRNPLKTLKSLVLAVTGDPWRCSLFMHLFPHGIPDNSRIPHTKRFKVHPFAAWTLLRSRKTPWMVWTRL